MVSSFKPGSTSVVVVLWIAVAVQPACMHCPRDRFATSCGGPQNGLLQGAFDDALPEQATLFRSLPHSAGRWVDHVEIMELHLERVRIMELHLFSYLAEGTACFSGYADQ